LFSTVVKQATLLHTRHLSTQVKTEVYDARLRLSQAVAPILLIKWQLVLKE